MYKITKVKGKLVMKLKIDYKYDVISLPLSVTGFLENADINSLKLLILAASDKEMRDDFSSDEAAKRLGISKKDVEASLDKLRSEGMLTCEGEEKGKKKTVVTKHKSDNGREVSVVHAEGDISYTGDELSRIFSERPSLSRMMDECSAIAGKIFSVSESNKIVGLVDYLRLEPEYVMMLFTYCKKIDKCSVHYIERMAYNLYNEGIVTYTALEASLTEMEKQRSFEGRIRSLMGLGTRALTAAEKKCLKLWCDLGHTDELITLAYEVAVNNTGSPSFPYMNKVLSNWREAGYKNAEDVNRAAEEYRKKKETTSGSFSTDEFFEAALERSYNSLEEK